MTLIPLWKNKHRKQPIPYLQGWILLCEKIRCKIDLSASAPFFNCFPGSITYFTPFLIKKHPPFGNF